jgi:hypothetical protein
LGSIEELVWWGRVYVTRGIDNRLLRSTWLKASAVEGIVDVLVVDVEVGWLKLALVLLGMSHS